MPARSALARFVGARTTDLAFVTNATTAVNAVGAHAGSLSIRIGVTADCSRATAISSVMVW